MSEEIRSEAARLLRELAGTRAGDSVKAAIQRASRKLPSWSYNRVADVWRNERRVAIRADEIEQLRAATKGRAEGGGMNELQELRSRIERLEALLAVSANVGRDAVALNGSGARPPN